MNHCALVLAAVLVAEVWGMVPAAAGDIEVEAQADAMRREQIDAERNDRRSDQQQTHDRREKDQYDWQEDIQRWRRDEAAARREDEHERIERQLDDVTSRDQRERNVSAEQSAREVRQEREQAER